MKVFTVYRQQDETQVSGTGRIMDGVIFHTGQVAICWRTDIEGAKHGHSSVELFNTWEGFKFVHVESHPDNLSRIVFFDLEESD
jgi:hypothetical protein